MVSIRAVLDLSMFPIHLEPLQPCCHTMRRDLDLFAIVNDVQTFQKKTIFFHYIEDMQLNYLNKL